MPRFADPPCASQGRYQALNTILTSLRQADIPFVDWVSPVMRFCIFSRRGRVRGFNIRVHFEMVQHTRPKLLAWGVIHVEFYLDMGLWIFARRFHSKIRQASL